MTFAATTLANAIDGADGKIEAARDQHERLPTGDDCQERGVAENIEDINNAVEMRLNERHHDDDDEEQERQQPGPREPLAKPSRETLAWPRIQWPRRSSRGRRRGASSSLKKDASTLLSVFFSPCNSATTRP